MGTQMVPLVIDLIDEGRFKANLDEAMKEAQQKLLHHVRKYGEERCKKATAELQIKVVMRLEETGDYSVKGSVSTKLPGRPSSLTIAIHEKEQDGQEYLFVRKSGGTDEHPRQAKLATKDGRTISPETGEPLPGDDKKREEGR